MLIRFRDIPAASRFAVFDKGAREKRRSWTIPRGDTDIETDIPDDWDDPFRNLRSRNYFIPAASAPIGDQADLTITGADYYIEISPETAEEERNWHSVETLVHALSGSDALDGRQKFYVSLVSLQSYFEFLVHGMLVLSGHVSKTRFEALNGHKERTEKAFDEANTAFFSTEIAICPGKEGRGIQIPCAQRTEAKRILDSVRTLRNKVVHAWGFKDVGRGRIANDLASLGEQLGYQESDDTFHEAAAVALVRLYARVYNTLATQLSYFVEKAKVNAERRSREY